MVVKNVVTCGMSLERLCGVRRMLQRCYRCVEDDDEDVRECRCGRCGVLYIR